MLEKGLSQKKSMISELKQKNTAIKKENEEDSTKSVSTSISTAISSNFLSSSLLYLLYVMKSYSDKFPTTHFKNLICFDYRIA